MKKLMISVIAAMFAVSAFAAGSVDSKKVDSTKKAPKEYKIIAGSDTTSAIRGDTLDVTFSPSDSLKIIGKWKNKKTGKEELVMEAHGKKFYLQPGYTSIQDPNTKNIHIVGVVGDDTIPDGNMPVGATAGIILLCLVVAAGASKALRLW